MQNWADIEIVYQGLKSKWQAATIIYFQDMKQLSPPEFFVIKSNPGGTTSTCTVKFVYFLNASLKMSNIHVF